MNTALTKWHAAVNAGAAVKMIAGISNFDLDQVLNVVRAATAAGAHAVDVAADVEIVKAVKSVTPLAVFASSVSPQALADAVEAGADVAELGNFDALYEQGVFISADAVEKLAAEAIALIQQKAPVCVTIPGHLSADAQVRLALALEAMGVQLLQTEGAARALATEPATANLSAEQKFAITLSNTKALAQATSLPVMTASGIAAGNVEMALNAGASAVGVGSFVNKAESLETMQVRAASVMNVIQAISERKPVALAG